MDETLNIVSGEWNCFLCTFATDTNLVLMEHMQHNHFQLDSSEPKVRINDSKETDRVDIRGTNNFTSNEDDAGARDVTEDHDDVTGDRDDVTEGEVDSRFRCSHCPKTYSMKTSLLKHLRTVKVAIDAKLLSHHKRQNSCFSKKKKPDLKSILAKRKLDLSPEKSISSTNSKITKTRASSKNTKVTEEKFHRHSKKSIKTTPDRKTGETGKHKTQNKASTEEVVFDCDLCHKSFGKKRNLLRHANSHKRKSNDEQNVTRETIVDDKTFELTNEVSNDQIQSGKERFNCQDCTNSFSTKSNLRRHVVRKHAPHSSSSFVVLPDPKLVNDQLRVCLKKISPKGSAGSSTFVVKRIAILKKNISHSSLKETSVGSSGKAKHPVEP